MLQILKREIDAMTPESLSPPSNMIISWKGKLDKDELTVLKQRVNLVGAKKPSNFFTLFVDPNVDVQDESKGVVFVVLHWNFNCSLLICVGLTEPTSATSPEILLTSGASPQILPTSGTSPEIQPKSTTTVQIQPMTHPLKQSEFAKYVASDITHRWFMFGLLLSIPLSNLEEIEHDHMRDPFRCFMAVFSLWEQRAEEPFTWKTVFDILSSKAMDEKPLAMKIKYHFLHNTS